MHLRKWTPVAAALALLAAPAVAQTPPPAIPIPPVGTAPPPSQPVSSVPAAASRPPLPSPAQAPAAAAAATPPGAVAAAPGIPPLPAPPVPLSAPASEPKAVRVTGDNEAEIPRLEYRARLTACLTYSSRCVPAGLTQQDRDYFRYELRGQRFPDAVVGEIVTARMGQFTSQDSNLVIVPKLAEGARPGSVERMTTIENRGDVEGYGLAVTLAHPDARASAVQPRGRRAGPVRSAAQGSVPDWW